MSYDKGKSTLALAAHNALTGDSVHCWCEGGDETDDTWEVPPHLADEAQRIVDKKMREINEAVERRKAAAKLIVDGLGL